jgi:hypothetical protein
MKLAGFFSKVDKMRHATIYYQPEDSINIER